MSKVVEQRTYRDGSRFVTAEILDNGCVRFITNGNDVETAAVSAEVLEQLAAMARKVRTLP